MQFQLPDIHIMWFGLIISLYVSSLLCKCTITQLAIIAWNRLRMHPCQGFHTFKIMKFKTFSNHFPGKNGLFQNRRLTNYTGRKKTCPCFYSMWKRVATWSQIQLVSGFQFSRPYGIFHDQTLKFRYFSKFQDHSKIPDLFQFSYFSYCMGPPPWINKKKKKKNRMFDTK